MVAGAALVAVLLGGPPNSPPDGVALIGAVVAGAALAAVLLGAAPNNPPEAGGVLVVAVFLAPRLPNNPPEGAAAGWADEAPNRPPVVPAVGAGAVVDVA